MSRDFTKKFVLECEPSATDTVIASVIDKLNRQGIGEDHPNYKSIVKEILTFTIRKNPLEVIASVSKVTSDECPICASKALKMVKLATGHSAAYCPTHRAVLVKPIES